MLIAGTVPQEDLPLIKGTVRREGDVLKVNDYALPCTQGTSAMVSAALTTTSYLGLEPPRVLLVGDIGKGKGSRELYQYLIDRITDLSPRVLALHYCLPIVRLMQKFYSSVEKCKKKPLLIADAGSMYAAKAAGVASRFDIFTPDLSEISFLADPEAVHPAYISHHLFSNDSKRIPELIKKAYSNKAAAKVLLVKGAVDYIAKSGEIIETVEEPNIPELECIGGTGDTITGIVTALAYAELELEDAAIISAKANRVAGQMSKATPATKVGEVIDYLPSVFKENICQWSGVCIR